MGGIFSGGSTKLAKWAKPYAQQGLADAQGVFNANQGNLTELTDIASDAFKANSGGFGTSPYVDNAKGAARTISNGFFLGNNPGQSTYDRLQGQGGGMFGSMGKPMADTPGGVRGGRDPSMRLLGGMATNTTPYNGSATLQGLTRPGENPGDQFAGAVAQGQYLNNQPSSGLYGEMMDRSYSTSNPFLDDIIRQNNENVTTQANRQFGARGMGAGISSAFADVLSRNLADTGGQLRYQNYNDAENRRLQAGGQSDAVWSGERGRMGDMAGLLSNNFNAGQDRTLAAGQGLMEGDQANRAQQLSAAQSLGSQFNQGADRGLLAFNTSQDRSLDAARAGDAARSDQVAQMLQALGLTGQLEGAGYAGYAPLTDLLKTSATLPYTGLDSYQTALANILGTTKVTKGPGIGNTIAGGIASGVGSALTANALSG